MGHRIFVDGQEGTTGLKIQEYLSGREDLEVLKIDYEKRKDIKARRELLNEADLVFLCLPDAAAREAAALIENNHTKVIDASTAHRTDSGWVYGLPELGEAQRERIRNASRVANPGCHATGFILSVYPLIKAGILPRGYPVSCTSVTGYSGGGRKLIAEYEALENQDYFRSPKPYSLTLKHKHLPEMMHMTGLEHPPVFFPIVADYYNGMTVSVPLAARALNKNAGTKEIWELLSQFYADEPFIHIVPYQDYSLLDERGFLHPEALNGSNKVEIFVFGHEDQILLIARYDNLGKGASGAAVQNMNLMLGLPETAGL
jgi:N-acetyl-gamma-glutamyl-phosphate reductase